MIRSRLSRDPDIGDRYGVDLFVRDLTGKGVRLWRTIGATSVSDLWAIALECDFWNPEVVRLDAFGADGKILHRLIRDGVTWRPGRIQKADSDEA